tara:strand:- start:987 stop:1094 length:108 start_codon:yes stop_codon:yes gene_type:complete
MTVMKQIQELCSIDEYCFVEKVIEILKLDLKENKK